MAQRVDEGHERTDKTIEEIEKQLEKEYQQASKEVTAKWDDYWKRHAAKDSIKQQQVASGKITLEEYAEWKHGQLCVGQRWKDLKDQLAQDLTNVDAKARSITQGHMHEVYALNHNYATFQVERDSMIDTSYTLYNRRAVENMARDDRSLLPYPDEDSPTAKMLREHKDREWNRQHIHSAITQGILQGESNPQIAKRLQNVVGMDKKAAIRNARTMMTGVENKARQDAYDDLKEKGIDIREKWIAILDGRTRASHRWMHGSYKDPETGEYDNGLRYPADPNGDPSEVYNCRCCEIAEVLGHSIEAPKYSPKIKGMTFDEWQKSKGEPIWKETNAYGLRYGKHTVSGQSVTLKKADNHIFTLGTETNETKLDADAYKVGNITVYYPRNIDQTMQTLKPQDIIGVLGGMDEKFLSQIQRDVEIVDLRNPMDSYWEQRYKMKNFRSYATGGKKITFYKWEGQHDPQFVEHTVRHEGGHYIDRVNSSKGLESGLFFSDEGAWEKAQKADARHWDKEGMPRNEGMWISNYSRTSKSVQEDFADSVAECEASVSYFKNAYPNRYEVLKGILGYED